MPCEPGVDKKLLLLITLTMKVFTQDKNLTQAQNRKYASE